MAKREKYTELVLRVAKFSVVGGTGFVTDAIVLWLGTQTLGYDPYSTRVVAICCAAFVTWQLNRRFTFVRSTDGAAREAGRYGTVVLISALVNYAAYSLLLLTFADLSPFIALIFGSGVAMVVSFIGYDRWAFKR